ncbi:MAG: chorismate mutase [Chloroflexi bacterium]|nr:chorismate mutase [Chloroflexota bacterium]
MKCRGIRGATTVESNTKEALAAATKELLGKLEEANQVRREDVAFIYFTTTHDLNASFPAATAREMGWTDVALLCGHEMNVPGSLARCLRILLLVNTEKRPEELVHIYIRGAKNLRSWERPPG